MDDHAILEAQRFTRREAVTARLGTLGVEIFHPERIYREEPVIAGVPARRVIEIGWIIEDQNTYLLTFNGSFIVDPIGAFAPHVFLRLGAFRIGHDAALLAAHAVGYANGEEGFLGVREFHRSFRSKNEIHIYGAQVVF